MVADLISQTGDLLDDQTSYATSQAIQGFDDNPDDAARAYSIERHTGVPGLAYLRNKEMMDQQHRGTLANQILQTSPALRDYVISHPLAPKVSNDDYGNLSNVEKAFNRFGPSSVVKAYIAAHKKFAEGFTEKFDIEPTMTVPEAFFSGDTPEAVRARQFYKDSPFLANIVGGVYAAGIGLPSKFFQGLLGGTNAYTRELLERAGMDPYDAKRLARELTGMVEYTAMVDPVIAMQIHNAQTYGKRFIAAGEEPPPGNKSFDQVKAAEAKNDVKVFDDVIKEAHGSNTYARSQEMLVQFLKQNPEATNIHIPVDVVRKLYGDEVPFQGDKKLGFIPDLAQQLKTAGEFGEDIVVPTPEYIAKVDPELHKALRDDIRLRENGLTINEAKELEKVKEEELQPIPLVEPLPKGDEVTQTVETLRETYHMPSVPKGWEIGEGGLVRPPPGEKAFQTLEPAGRIKARIYDRSAGRTTGHLEFEPLGKTSLKKALSEASLNRLDYKFRTYDVEVISNTVQRVAGDTPVYVITEEQMRKLDPSEPRGFYDPVSHDIFMQAYVYREGAEGARTLFHEGVHAATVRQIVARPELERQLREIMIEIANAKPELLRTYEMSNVKEFIVGFTTTPDFQKNILDIRMSPEYTQKYGVIGWREVTAYRAIVDFIRNVLRLPRKYVSALEAAMKAFEDVTETKLTPKELSVWEQYQKGYGALPTTYADPKKPQEMMEPTAIGMTKAQFKLLGEKLEKQKAEDAAAELERGKKFEEKKQTKEWKEAEKEIRDEVKADVPGRPDIAVALFFRENMWMGNKLTGSKPKIDPKYLGDSDRIAVPPDLLKKGGYSPDDLAPSFGMQSGRELIDAILEWDAKRGDMDNHTYLNKVIREEVAKRMEYRFGELPENILEEAQTHVLSDTAMDVLHEQTVAMAMHAGIGITTRDGLPFTRKNVDAWVKQMFNESRYGRISVKSYLRYAGKTGEMAEKLLKDDPAGALKAQQNQYYQAALAREAMKFEKEQKQMGRMVQRYNRARYPENRDPEFTEHIQQILERFDRLRPTTRSVADLQEALNKRSLPGLEEFWDANRYEHGFQNLADFLADPTFRRDLEDLTVGEWRQVRNAVKVLDKAGKDVREMDVQGAKFALEKFVEQVGEGIKDRGIVDQDIRIDKRGSTVWEAMREYLAGHITTESTMNRLDSGNKNGLLHRAVIYPTTAAANEASAALKRYQTRMTEAVGDLRRDYMKKRVENDLWENPLKPGEFLDLSMRNVLGMLQNIGNAANRKKLFEGYRVEEAEGMKWIFDRITKDDLDRAVRIGKIFEEAFEEASRMYQRLSGEPLERIDVGVVNTPWGTIPGWYNPIHYDSRFPNQPPRGLHGLEDAGFIHPTVPNAYTKRRTGYIGAMELDLNIVPVRLRQMIYDTAMREAVTEVAKLFRNPEFKRIVTNAVGDVRYKELMPWLKDVANMANHQSEVGFMQNKAMEMVRQNMIAVLIGFNPSTVIKHGTTAWFNSTNQVGIKNFGAAMFSLFSQSPEIGKNNLRFAFEKSTELQRRQRNWHELITGQPEITLQGNSLRDKIIALGSTPVALGDMLSSVPTWLAEYKEAIRTGATEGDAIIRADTAVRQAHGSSVITNRPRYMRSSNPLGHWFASLYGFFSHMFQKQYEMAWRSKDLINKMRGEPGLEKLNATNYKEMQRLSNMFVSYVVIPAVIEELVTPYMTGDQHSIGEKVAYSLAIGISGSWIGMRDFVRGLINLRDPQAGIITPAYKYASELGEDILQPNKSLSYTHFGRTLSHATDVIGLTTGLTNHTEGKMLEFMWRYNQGLEYPRGVGDWMTGLKKGTLKPPPRRNL